MLCVYVEKFNDTLKHLTDFLFHVVSQHILVSHARLQIIDSIITVSFCKT